MHKGYSPATVSAMFILLPNAKSVLEQNKSLTCNQVRFATCGAPMLGGAVFIALQHQLKSRLLLIKSCCQQKMQKMTKKNQIHSLSS